MTFGSSIREGQPRQQGREPFPSRPSARNNPGGLRYPGSTRFRSFRTEAEGIAAQEQQLHRYLGRGINTLRGIVETYAPRRSRGGDNSDASVNNYIAYVARRRGISPDQPLSANDVQSVAQAMREFETGNTR